MQPKISIIVPVYRVPEKYLRKCIESLINQTFKEIEILLIDDGSPDNCGEICDEYRKSDKRIKVIHQKNKGLSGARNTGVKEASGDWITFVDGDDWVESNMCEVLYSNVNIEHLEIICCGVIKDYDKKSYKYKYEDYEDGKVYIDSECKYMQSKLLDFNGNNAWAYAKLINKEFMLNNNIFHNEKLKQGAEALEFNIRLFEHANKIKFVKKYLYHYIYNDESISTTHNEENHYLVVKCFNEIKNTITKSENKQKLLELFYNRFIYVIVTTAISGYFNPINKESYKIKVKKYKEYLNQPLVKEVINNCKLDNISITRKITFYLIKYKVFFGVAILGFLRKIQLNNK